MIYQQISGMLCIGAAAILTLSMIASTMMYTFEAIGRKRAERQAGSK